MWKDRVTEQLGDTTKLAGSKYAAEPINDEHFVYLQRLCTGSNQDGQQLLVRCESWSQAADRRAQLVRDMTTGIRLIRDRPIDLVKRLERIDGTSGYGFIRVCTIGSVARDRVRKPRAGAQSSTSTPGGGAGRLGTVSCLGSARHVVPSVQTSHLLQHAVAVPGQRVFVPGGCHLVGARGRGVVARERVREADWHGVCARRDGAAVCVAGVAVGGGAERVLGGCVVFRDTAGTVCAAAAGAGEGRDGELARGGEGDVAGVGGETNRLILVPRTCPAVPAKVCHVTWPIRGGFARMHATPQAVNHMQELPTESN